MNVVTAPFEGIGASVRRKEDLRFLSGRGQYTDDIARPGQAHAYHPPQPPRPRAHPQAWTPRRPAPCRAWSRSTPARTRPSSAASPAAGAINNKDGSPMAEPKHPVLAEGKARHVGDPVAVVVAETRAEAKDAAEAIEVEYDVLPALADHAGSARPRRAAAPRQRGRQPLLRLAHRRQGGDRRRLRPRPQGRPLRDHQQPPGAERHGAALGHRRVRPHHRRAHALDHQPEPARHPPADGRLRAQHPGVASSAWWRRTSAAASAARSTTTPRRPSSPGRRRQAAPPGEVDLRPQRGLHLRRPRPRPRHHLRAGAGRERQVPRPPRPHAGQHGRLPLHLRALRADLPLRHPARRRVRDAHHLRRGEGGLHLHRRRWTPTAAPAGRRRPTCSNVWWTSPRRRRASTASRSAGATSSRPPPSPTRRRWRCSTTAATTSRRSTRRWKRPAGPASRRAAPRRPRRASSAASASPPTWRPAASRPRPWSARSAPAPGSTRSAPSASTRRAASPC